MRVPETKDVYLSDGKPCLYRPGAATGDVLKVPETYVRSVKRDPDAPCTHTLLVTPDPRRNVLNGGLFQEPSPIKSPL